MTEPWIDQYGVADLLATPEQLKARAAGRYDPRPASGKRIARRVNLRCARCQRIVGHLDEHERRHVWHSTRTGAYGIDPRDLKCQDCYAPLEPFTVDVDRIMAAARRHQRGRPPVSVNVGESANPVG